MECIETFWGYRLIPKSGQKLHNNKCIRTKNLIVACLFREQKTLKTDRRKENIASFLMYFFDKMPF